jgi:predicted secreted protein
MMKVRSRLCALAAVVLVAPVLLVTAAYATTTSRLATDSHTSAPAPVNGYWEVASDGGIFSFNAPFQGSMGNKPLDKPIVGIAADPATGGYWEVASDGGIFSFNAPFEGSMGDKPLNAPIVGIAADPLTGGYWEVASDGGIFSFDAPFYGSMGNSHLNAPIVGIAADPATGGYWEVASDGGIFSFNAPFSGSMGNIHLDKPIVGIAADPVTGGYWEVASDGGIFSFGLAPFQGSMGAKPLDKPIVGMAADPATGGYWEVASDGGIFSFDAPFQGSMGSTPLNKPVVGMAASAITAPTAPAGATSSASGSSNSYAGTATATNDSTTASATGIGALTVAEYASDPAGAPTFTSAGEYFDVALSSGNSFSSTTVNDCNLNGGNALQWWYPAANSGAGAWEAVTPAPTYTVGPPACALVTLNSTSSPTLAQLTGTVFAVQAGALIQGSVTSATRANGAGYSGELFVTSGTGNVTYTETASSASTEVVVSSSGAITAAATLVPGTYSVSGTDVDQGSDNGTWAFALTVTALVLAQSSPNAATVTNNVGYSGQLAVSNGLGTVSYTETVSAASTQVVVGSTGVITAAATLPPGTYAVSGGISDTRGDAGTWTFTLTINSILITQTSSGTGTVTTTASAAYTSNLTTSGNIGTVTFVTGTTNPSINVSGTGVITTVGGPLVAATYTVSGTDHDGRGDSGTWSFALTVNAVTLVEGATQSASISPGAGYSGQLTVNNGTGTVAWTENSSASSGTVVVNGSGVISVSTSVVTPGTYTVTGNDSDAEGDTGTWTFAVTVT